jgi:hypothetical protein
MAVLLTRQTHLDSGAKEDAQSAATEQRKVTVGYVVKSLGTTAAV